MTVKELRELLKDCPDDAPIRKEIHFADGLEDDVDVIIRDIAVGPDGSPVLKAEAISFDDDFDDDFCADCENFACECCCGLIDDDVE